MNCVNEYRPNPTAPSTPLERYHVPNQKWVHSFLCKHNTLFYYFIPLNFTIFTSIQHPKHSLYKTMIDSVSKWLKATHRGSNFHESPIGAARGLHKANSDDSAVENNTSFLYRTNTTCFRAPVHPFLLGNDASNFLGENFSIPKPTP